MFPLSSHYLRLLLLEHLTTAQNVLFSIAEVMTAHRSCRIDL